jgi:predicted Zn finger-like uncharacterized protein
MAIYVVCPHCGATRYVRDELLGKRLRCAKCQEVIETVDGAQMGSAREGVHERSRQRTPWEGADDAVMRDPERWRRGRAERGDERDHGARDKKHTPLGLILGLAGGGLALALITIVVVLALPKEQAKAPDVAQKMPAEWEARRIHIRSVEPEATKLAAAGSQQRSFVKTYGLTHKDLEAISSLPSVAAALPTRTIVQEIRRLNSLHTGTLTACTPELAEHFDLTPASGRFFSPDDNREQKKVVVLGAVTAQRLFPANDAIGESVIINKHAYEVIGVLRENHGPLGPYHRVSEGAFIPLLTYRARFGETVFVRPDRREGERVQLSEIHVFVCAAREVPATLESIRTLLEESHSQEDWEIRTPFAAP